MNFNFAQSIVYKFLSIDKFEALQYNHVVHKKLSSFKRYYKADVR